MIRIDVILAGVRRTARRDRKLLQKRLPVLRVTKVPREEGGDLNSKILKRLLLMSLVSCHILGIVAVHGLAWWGGLPVGVSPAAA
jgi:hypothetical protein